MRVGVVTTIRIELVAGPGEIVLKRPYLSHDSFSLASCWVSIAEYTYPAVDGGEPETRAYAHLHPKTGFKCYRERREGGFSKASRSCWPGFMLRVEMLPDEVLASIKAEYAAREHFTDILPPWDVIDGKDVSL